MPSYPLPTLAAQVTPTGITAPAIEDIINSLVASFQSIYGSDVYLTPDTQDYQWIGIIAAAINDSNNTAIQIYNGFLPTFAQGVFLSMLVKINGLQRNTGNNSTVPVEVIGTAGTSIPFGVVQDSNGNLWDLPPAIEIPDSGTLTVTATCETPGNVAALAQSVVIYTPLRGWQSAAFTSNASAGVSTETDAALRRRQTISTSLPSVSPMAAILAQVANVSGVTRYTLYNNPGSTTDANGIPSHSISVIVKGGDPVAVATAIEETKSPGCGTYGTTSEIIEDEAGIPEQINFFELDEIPIFVTVDVTSLSGWVAGTAAEIQAAVAAFINGLAIGQDVLYDWMFGPATLYGSPLQFTFKVTSLTIGFSSMSEGTADLDLLFNQAATCVIGDVVVNVA